MKNNKKMKKKRDLMGLIEKIEKKAGVKWKNLSPDEKFSWLMNET